MPPTGWQDWGCWGWRRFNPSQCQVPIPAVPAASTSAAHGLARSGVSGVLGVTLAVQAGCAIRPTTSEECAYGRHSPSDAFERVRRVEVLGLATDGCWI